MRYPSWTSVVLNNVKDDRTVHKRETNRHQGLYMAKPLFRQHLLQAYDY